ncbi:unnamed protein product [Meganyctiphanes norvegica]|uniref:Uncharacterized protein n=1 Tax=Meganyctiphanes norvegica TaxID=48144 RepID=A0AAV2QXS1_MEGNR
MDWVPVLSQTKSLIQVTFGDKEGAKKTQENFVRQCPVISQVTSAVQAAKGDQQGARDTQKQFVQVLSGFTDSIPVVGHVKGGIHYACGDKDGGDRAMKSSSHTTVVMGAGVGGFMVAGPVGAVGAGTAAGVAMDGITTGVEYAVSKEFKPEGVLRPIKDPKNPGLWVDSVAGVIGDGVAGLGAGKLANAKFNPSVVDGFTDKISTPATGAEKLAGQLKDLKKGNVSDVLMGDPVIWEGKTAVMTDMAKSQTQTAMIDAVCKEGSFTRNAITEKMKAKKLKRKNKLGVLEDQKSEKISSSDDEDQAPTEDLDIIECESECKINS